MGGGKDPWWGRFGPNDEDRGMEESVSWHLSARIVTLAFSDGVFGTGIDHRGCYGNEFWAFFWALEAFRSWECMGVLGLSVCWIDSGETMRWRGWRERERGGI